MRKLIIHLFTCCLLFTTAMPAFAKPSSHHHADKLNAGSLVAGDSYTGVLNPDSKVLMWGSNVSGQLGTGDMAPSLIPVEVEDLTGVVALATGVNHTVALKADGSVMAWGDNASGQLGDGSKIGRLRPVVIPGLINVVAVAAGNGYSIALKADGTVMAWGNNASGQLGNGSVIGRLKPVVIPGLTNVVAVAAGNGHAVALKVDGSVMAWGGNASGQLGNGSKIGRLRPVLIPGLIKVVAVAAGGKHTVALKADGSVMAWGDNASGQLGDGSIIGRLSPVVIPEIKVVAVAAGDKHTVALKADGSVMAWGDNASGQLGDGISMFSFSPLAVNGLTGVAVIAAGNNHSVALKADGTVVAWGNNASGQLGNNSKIASSIPVAVLSLPKLSTANAIASVAVGVYHTVALKGDGTVVAWGDNQYGQLGDGSTTNRLSPVAVPGLTDVVAVAVGVHYTVALKADGQVMAWGRNSQGQLGNGDTTNQLSPVPIPNLTDVVAMAAGDLHVAALKADGTVMTWGWNSDGQLGHGTTLLSLIPVKVSGLADVVAVDAGYSHTVALKADGKVMTWGRNLFGQLGDSSRTNRLRPVQVPRLARVAAIAAGYDHTVVRLANGWLAAWGKNDSGQLGDGTLTNRSTPVLVWLAGAVAVAAGYDHTLAIKTNGSLAAWGGNAFGQLGDGSMTRRLLPEVVSGLGGVRALTAGQFYSIGLKADGKLVAWGLNGNGQLGDGTKIQHGSPVDVLGFGTMLPVLYYSGEVGYGLSGVSPTSGLVSTLLTYKVVYTDPANIKPSFIRVCIDGASSCNDMNVDSVAVAELRDGNYANGEQYVYTTTLKVGAHSYYFVVSNCLVCKRLPASSGNSGPSISGNYIDLVISSVSKAKTSVNIGSKFDINSQERNQGTIDIADSSYTVGYYLSLDNRITATEDIRLTGSKVGIKLAAGGDSVAVVTPVIVPLTVEPGVYYVGACADVANILREEIETNNCRLASGSLVGATTITVIRAVDLVMTVVSKTAVRVPIGRSFSIVSAEKNLGKTSTSASSNKVMFYLSGDSHITTGDIPLSGTRSVFSLLANGVSASLATTVTVPTTVTPRVYYVGACADATRVQPETVESNNCKVALGVIRVVLDVDLVISEVNKNTAGVIVGNSFDISSNVRNIGLNDMTAISNTVKFYLSGDANITTDDILLTGSRTVLQLAAGASEGLLTATVTVPLTVRPRSYYVGACADATKLQIETNEGNNCKAVTGPIDVTPDVDLIMSVVNSLDSYVPIGTSFNIFNTIKNQGAGGMLSSHVVKFYLSTDATISESDIKLTGERIVNALAANASSSASTQVTVPVATPPGTYFVGAIADGNKQQVETNEANNSNSPSIVTITVN